MSSYHDLYDQSAKTDMDQYPAGDDAVGKPKGKGKGIKNKIGPGGTKAKKTATTTAGPDARMTPSDAYKASPDPQKAP